MDQGVQICMIYPQVSLSRVKEKNDRRNITETTQKVILHSTHYYAFFQKAIGDYMSSKNISVFKRICWKGFKYMDSPMILLLQLQ